MGFLGFGKKDESVKKKSKKKGGLKKDIMTVLNPKKASHDYFSEPTKKGKNKHKKKSKKN